MKTSIAISHKIKRTQEDWIVDTIVYALAIFTFIIAFYPFFLSIVLAFNEGKDATYGGIFFWPRKFTTDNFVELLNDPAWGKALLITVLRTVLGTGITVFFTCLVAYGLSAKNLMFRKFYMSMVIFSMYFSGGIIPYYMVIRSMHLTNSFLVYIIPTALNTFFLIVAISFFQDIPKDLAESASIDGAGELTILRRIILPISKPLLATIAIFTAVTQWNSWYDTAFFTQNKGLRTMGYLLMSVIKKSSMSQSNMDSYAASIADSTITTVSVQLAAMIVAVAPILLIYPLFQRYIVSGLTLGSVKG